MKFIKILYLTCLILLSSCLVQANTKKQPLAKNGILDLRGWSMEKDGPVNLVGEWNFYWKQLLTAEDFAQDTKPEITRDRKSVV